jgi:hypothetical protein
MSRTVIVEIERAEQRLLPACSLPHHRRRSLLDASEKLALVAFLRSLDGAGLSVLASKSPLPALP